jgi:hypothetical protein
MPGRSTPFEPERCKEQNISAPVKRALKTSAGILAIVLTFLLYSWASERYYFATKDPGGILTVSDYFKRFGEPSFVRMLERDGHGYYEFTGRVDQPWWCLSLPSDAPACLFDERGKFVEWCADPRDESSYRKRWSLKSAGKVAVDDIKRKFGL